MSQQRWRLWIRGFCYWCWRWVQKIWCSQNEFTKWWWQMRISSASTSEVQLHLIHDPWLGVSMYFLGQPSDSKGVPVGQITGNAWGKQPKLKWCKNFRTAFQDFRIIPVSMTRHLFPPIQVPAMPREDIYSQVTGSLESLGKRPFLDFDVFAVATFDFWTWASSCDQDRGCQHEWTVKQLQDAVELLEESHLCGSAAVSRQALHVTWDPPFLSARRSFGPDGLGEFFSGHHAPIHSRGTPFWMRRLGVEKMSEFRKI